MRKLTRRSYNRKLLVFGASMFMAVAMMSTGFAAWVMSSVTNADVDAPVHVGVVTDASMEITVDQWVDGAWTGGTLTFDALENDLGRVYAGEGSVGENLSFLISGKVTNAQALGTLTVAITLPSSLKNAIDAGYLKAVDADNYSNGVITYTVNGDSLEFSEGTTKTFAYTLELAWGDFFGNKNPAIFYDSEEDFRDDVAGKSIPDDQVKTEMNAFGDTMKDGLVADGEPATSYSGTIDILVSATVKG